MLPKAGYQPSSADRIAWARRWRGSKIERRNLLKTHILESLAMERSPEQIVGRLRLEGSSHRVSVETIYAWVYSPAGRREGAHRLLAQAKSRRGRRTRKGTRMPPIPNRISIHDRPESARDRREPGHWEADLMLFGGQRPALLTMTERKSRLLLACKMPDRTAKTTARTMSEMLLAIPKTARNTITLDNGGEFYQHHKLPIKTYFCDPHSPWQRGAVENANGILRRSLPRKTKINHWRDRDIDDIIWTYNTTPRKCLGYLTPIEAFAKDQGVALEI